MHNVSNITKMLKYLDTKGIDLKVEWDKALTQSDPLHVEIDPNEELEVLGALKYVESMACKNSKIIENKNLE